MNTELINLITQDIYYPEIDIKQIIDTEKMEGTFFESNGNVLIFNGFETSKQYIDFIWVLKDSLEVEIKQNIQSSTSRLKTLYYIKQLKLHIYKFKKLFKDKTMLNLSEAEQAIYKYCLKNKTNMPSEFYNVEEILYKTNKNISFSEDFKNKIGEIEKLDFEKFEFRFFSIQYEIVDELITMIDTFESFVENISIEEFKNKDDFFEADFHTLTLSDTVKLTDKEINMKIETLDIRQTALFFDYLEKAKLILKYNNSGKANFAHYLTGHSKDKIRTDKGFGMIEDIRTDRLKPTGFENEEFYNLNSVKNQLQKVIEMIDGDIIGLSKNKRVK